VIFAVPGIWFIQRFFSTTPVAEKLLVTVADAKIPERGALVYRHHRFALIREQGQVYALSLVCTHLGCTLSVTDQQLSCPCHGSTFDRYGGVTRGPADKELPRLRIQRHNDDWLIYG
jgi:Rieske Fe-S protein